MEQNLKSGQRKVLAHLKDGRHVFGLMPTGYGKSRCFQIPAFCWGWRVLVVSPLISLMEDQALSVNEKEGAFALHSQQPAEERRISEQDLQSGKWSLVYISPERLVHWEQSNFLQKLQIDLIALDEAHCLKTWADFRPAYKLINPIIKKLGAEGTKVLALTATLPSSEGRKLMKTLCGHARTVAMPLGRENLATYLLPCERYGEKHLILTSILSRLGADEAAIVYCASRERTEELADVLSAMGFSAVAYHAGVPADKRSRIVRGFRLGRVRLICATSAFGMGIDYGQVRAVVHFDFPSSVEAYWQEAGRAGRDQKPAASVVLWTRSDLLRLRSLQEKEKLEAYHLIKLFLRRECRKRSLEEHFGMRYRSVCGGCNHCREKNLDNFPDILRGVDVFVDRCVWWLAEEAQPEIWMRKFLNIS